MELLVLGCWAPFPAPGGACPGYLVGDGEDFVLADCGHGVAARLFGRGEFGRLRAVFLSHLHPDHWYDLPALRHVLRAAAGPRPLPGGAPSGPLLLCAPNEPAASFTQLAGYTDAFRVRPVGIPAGVGVEGGALATVELGRLTVRFYATRHALPACCLEFGFGGRRLFYTGDTAWWDGLPVLAAGAEVILAEASLLSADRPYLPEDHLTAAEAGRLAREAGAKALILTHFWPAYAPDALYREAREHFGGEILLAREGEVYRF